MRFWMANLPFAHEQLARTLAARFAALPQVEAVALSGSFCSGAADALSDLDLDVYIRAEIPLAEREAIVAATGGTTRANLNIDFWGLTDTWFAASTGIEVDVMYFQADWVQPYLQRVLVEHQPSLGYTTCLWRTLHSSHLLYDPHDWLHTFQQQSEQPYPTPLQQNIIRFNHPVLRTVIPSYLQHIEKAAQRQDWVAINHRVAALFASYFDILFAFNKVLHPGPKRLLDFARRECARLPQEMASDVQAVLEANAMQVVARVNQLLDRLDLLLGEALN